MFNHVYIYFTLQVSVRKKAILILIYDKMQ